jgi:hypothetical protein
MLHFIEPQFFDRLPNVVRSSPFSHMSLEAKALCAGSSIDGLEHSDGLSQFICVEVDTSIGACLQQRLSPTYEGVNQAMPR